jgi:putative transposase
MPRKARIDAPGALQNVIVRGIEPRKIFRFDYDRKNLLDRVSVLIPQTDIECFDWAFMSNHFHLFLKTDSVPIAVLMRRLLTGYAGWFNKKYKRYGQLSQNRYKSFLCQEDIYLYDFERLAQRVAQVLSMEPMEVTALGKSPRTVKAGALLCF